MYNGGRKTTRTAIVRRVRKRKTTPSPRCRFGFPRTGFFLRENKFDYHSVTTCQHSYQPCYRCYRTRCYRSRDKNHIAERARERRTTVCAARSNTVNRETTIIAIVILRSGPTRTFPVFRIILLLLLDSR